MKAGPSPVETLPKPDANSPQPTTICKATTEQNYSPIRFQAPSTASTKKNKPESNPGSLTKPRVKWPIKNPREVKAKGSWQRFLASTIYTCFAISKQTGLKSN